MDWTQLFSQFAPGNPEVDPFSLGATLRQNPEAMADHLATLGPPPAQGEGFMDWLSKKLGNGAAAGMAPGVTDVPGIGAVPNTMPGMPSMPSFSGPGTGIETVPGVGPVPSGPMPALQRDYSGVTADEMQRGMPMKGRPSEATAPGVGSPLDITSDAQKGKDLASKLSGAGKALSNAASPFAGLKAPPAPATQHISSPGLPRPTQIQGGGIAALVQALLSGQSAAPQQLRLGNALYAGGRGLY